MFRSRGEVWLRLVVALVLVGGLAAGTLALVRFFAPFNPWPASITVAVVLAAFAFYCICGYFVGARPNHDELGGPLGSPLRWSDDANRLLLALKILLAPGRFISISAVDAFVLVTRRMLPQERFVRDTAPNGQLPKT